MKLERRPFRQAVRYVVEHAEDPDVALAQVRALLCCDLCSRVATQEISTTVDGEPNASARLCDEHGLLPGDDLKQVGAMYRSGRGGW